MERINQMKGAIPIVETGKKKSPPLFDFFMGRRKRRSVDNRQTDEAGYEQTGRQRRYNPTGNVGRAGVQQGGGTRAAYPSAQSGPPNYYGPRANPQPAYAGHEYGAPGARQQQYMENPSLPSGRANGAAPGPRQGAPPGHIPGPAYGPSYGPAPAGPVIPPAEGAGGDFQSVSRTMESDQPPQEYSFSSSQDDTISAEVLEKLKAVLGATKIDLPVDINDPYDLGLLLRHLRHHSNLLANIGDPDVRSQVLTAMQEDEYEEERDAATGAREELMALNAGGGERVVERRHIRANQEYSEQEEESDIDQDSQEEPSNYPDDYEEGVQASQYQNDMQSNFDQDEYEEERDAATGAREELMALNAGGGERVVERRHIRANQEYSEQEEESDIDQDSQEEPSDYPDDYKEGVQASQYQNDMQSDFDQYKYEEKRDVATGAREELMALNAGGGQRVVERRHIRANQEYSEQEEESDIDQNSQEEPNDYPDDYEEGVQASQYQNEMQSDFDQDKYEEKRDVATGAREELMALNAGGGGRVVERRHIRANQEYSEQEEESDIDQDSQEEPSDYPDDYEEGVQASQYQNDMQSDFDQDKYEEKRDVATGAREELMALNAGGGQRVIERRHIRANQEYSEQEEESDIDQNSQEEPNDYPDDYEEGVQASQYQNDMQSDFDQYKYEEKRDVATGAREELMALNAGGGERVVKRRHIRANQEYSEQEEESDIDQDSQEEPSDYPDDYKEGVQASQYQNDMQSDFDQYKYEEKRDVATGAREEFMALNAGGGQRVVERRHIRANQEYSEQEEESDIDQNSQEEPNDYPDDYEEGVQASQYQNEMQSDFDQDKYEEKRDVATGAREELMALNAGGGGRVVERRHIRANQEYSEQEEESDIDQDSQEEPSDYPDDYEEGVQASQYQNDMQSDFDQDKYEEKRDVATGAREELMALNAGGGQRVIERRHIRANQEYSEQEEESDIDQNSQEEPNDYPDDYEEGVQASQYQNDMQSDFDQYKYEEKRDVATGAREELMALNAGGGERVVKRRHIRANQEYSEQEEESDIDQDSQEEPSDYPDDYKEGVQASQYQNDMQSDFDQYKYEEKRDVATGAREEFMALNAGGGQRVVERRHIRANQEYSEQEEESDIDQNSQEEPNDYPDDYEEGVQASQYQNEMQSDFDQDKYEEKRDVATGAREELMALNAGGGGRVVERRHIRANQEYSEQEEESDIDQNSQEEPNDYPDDYEEGVQASQYQNNMQSDFDQESQQVFPFDDDYQRDLNEAVLGDGGMEEEQHRSWFENEFAQDYDNDEQEDDYIGDDSNYDDEDEPEYQQEERRYGQRPPYGPANNGQEDNYYQHQETRNNPYGQRQARAYNIRQGGSRGGVSQRRGRQT
ncbi:uncharacterized protein [Diadema setosum]|uniref:uncharacterized protein n=1 Tax=Diadema setosum TaxID=31175 RepID=UPI003B3B99C0